MALVRSSDGPLDLILAVVIFVLCCVPLSTTFWYVVTTLVLASAAGILTLLFLSFPHPWLSDYATKVLDRHSRRCEEREQTRKIWTQYQVLPK